MNTSTHPASAYSDVFLQYIPRLLALVVAMAFFIGKAGAQTFTSQDIGAVGLAGSSSLNSGVWTVAGSGGDIWGPNDAFRFVHTPATGDLNLYVEVPSQTNTNAWAKSGLMIREALGANARNVSMFTSPTSGVALQSRITVGGSTTTTTVASVASPRWLRLTRVGNVFTGYRSTDGVNWTVVGTRTVALNSAVFVGMAVCSHNNAALCTTTFRNLSIASASSPTEVILDNGAAGVVPTGTWTTATTPAGYYGANYLHDGAAGKGTKKVRYTPNLVAGVYAVSIRYPAAAGHSAATPVDVSHTQGLDLLSVDQRADGGVWRLLGHYRFATGNAGYVEIGNAGTTGLVVADAVRFTPIAAPSDVEVKSDALVSWNKPDGDGISCAQCHTPTGYDVAVFDFDQLDLRRATAPHLNDTDADRIFAYILQQRRDYPPAGGLKDVETFRPFQPTGVVLGGATSGNRVRDNAFADHIAANYLMAQANVIDTLAEANTALQQVANINMTQLPIGIAFNKWSESVSRSGAAEGGRVAEWLPGIGQQPKAASLAAWNALVNAYVADPSNANFWAMYHKMDDYLAPDPVNNAPVTSGNGAFTRQAFQIFRSNNLFAHNELNKARGLPELQFTDGVQPFPDQAGNGLMSPFWDVGNETRIAWGPLGAISEMPLRHQGSVYNGDFAFQFKERVNDQRIPWMWQGLMHDPVMWHSGDETATLQLEYLLVEGWARDLRMHNAFAAILLPTKRSLLPNSWHPPGRWPDLGHYQNTNIRLGTQFLGLERWKNEEWDTGTTAYTAYKRWIANGYRALILRQTWEIQQNGRHFNTDAGLNAAVEAIRPAINWADSANTTVNNQIVDALKAAVATYPE